MTEINQFSVKHEGKETIVIIPKTGDRSYDEYLEVAEREKTLDELKKRKTEKRTHSEKEVSAALKELSDFRKRKREGNIKKYY